MLAGNLVETYRTMRDLGLVKSKQEYCRFWLSRGRTFIRDIEVRGREDVRVPEVTVRVLRARLRAVAERVPRGIRGDIEGIIRLIDQGDAVAELLSRGR